MSYHVTPHFRVAADGRPQYVAVVSELRKTPRGEQPEIVAIGTAMDLLSLNDKLARRGYPTLSASEVCHG